VKASVSGHSRRVADLARKIALKLNFPATEAQDVMLAGLLHDVGKIGLPDELLSKPVSHMSGDELGLLRKHPVTGQAALMGLENLRKAGTFIRGHHERWDGQGYPDRLSGLAIPYGARVLAVANDFDALQIGTLSPRKLKQDEAGGLHPAEPRQALLPPGGGRPGGGAGRDRDGGPAPPTNSTPPPSSRAWCWRAIWSPATA
jgi:response regulator RpfG family c-di-GMP phosphodiesterase